MNCRSHQTGESAAEPMAPLSDRESDILLMTALGYSDQQIAGLMRVSVGSVGQHRHALCRKLGLGAAGGLDAMLAATFAHGVERDEATNAGRRSGESYPRSAGLGEPGYAD